MSDNELVIEDRLVNELSMIRKALILLVFYTANPASLDGITLEEIKEMLECT